MLRVRRPARSGGARRALFPAHVGGHPDAELDGATRPQGGLRGRTARGMIVNGAFMVGIGVVNSLKGLIAAAFLTAGQFGVWGVLAVTLMTLLHLKYVGVGDKFIQQDEADQQRAFQKAFTLDVLYAGLFAVGFLVAVPLLALAYGRSELLLPGLALAAVLPAISLQAPIWVFYRRMNFARQRSLQAVDPVVSIVVTVSLAVAGFGYWSLVLGTVLGSWAAALAAILASPYPLRWRYERGAVREYLHFSWPLVVAAGSAFLLIQGVMLASEIVLGLGAVGAIALTRSMTTQVQRANEVVTQTLYPAICAIRGRWDRLVESFAKSNRLAMLWGFPLGVGICLFSSDLVTFGIGEQWRGAVILFQLEGLNAAMNQIGVNWTAFYRARGDTRPIAIASAVLVAAALLIGIPLLVVGGLTGLAIGASIATAIGLVIRTIYVVRLFPGFPMAAHVARGIAPTLPAAACVLALRVADSGGGRGLEMALGELGLFVALVTLATLTLERTLVMEVLGYLRSRTGARAPAATEAQVGKA